MLLSFVDHGLEVLVRHQELLLLENRQVEEHTSDLRGLHRADELVDVVPDAITDLVPEVRAVLDAVVCVTALRKKLGDEADASTRKFEPLVDTEAEHEIDYFYRLAIHSQQLVGVFNEEQVAFIQGHTAIDDWLVSRIELLERI